MRKSILRLRRFIGAFGLIFLSGCFLTGGNPVDLSAPSIELHLPAPDDSLSAGAFVSFEAILKDDLELGSYSIDIHDNLDNHGHGRIAEIAQDPSLVRWSFKRNYTIPEGLILFVAAHDDDIEIPPNALAGPYDFIIQAVDQAGNATNYQDGSNVTFGIYVTNESQPVVSVINLVNGELELETEISFVVEGTIYDPTTGTYAGLNALEVVLGEDEDDGHDHSHLRIFQDGHEPLIDEDFGEAELNDFTIDGMVRLELVFQSINFILSREQSEELESENTDHLILTMRVTDNQGNVTVHKTVVHIHF